MSHYLDMLYQNSTSTVFGFPNITHSKAFGMALAAVCLNAIFDSQPYKK